MFFETIVCSARASFYSFSRVFWYCPLSKQWCSCSDSKKYGDYKSLRPQPLQRATTLSFHSFIFHLFPVALYASFIVCNKECGDQQSLTILWDRSLLKAQPGCLSIAFLFTCGPQTVARHEDEVALIQLFTIFQPNTHISPLFQETL